MILTPKVDAFRTLLLDPQTSGAAEHLGGLAKHLGLEPIALHENGGELPTAQRGFWLDRRAAQVIGPILTFPERLTLHANTGSTTKITLPPSPLQVIGTKFLGDYNHVGGSAEEGFHYDLQSARLYAESSRVGGYRLDELANLKSRISQGGPGVVHLTQETLALQLSVSPQRAREILEKAARRITGHRNFETAVALARANSNGKFYLVGSKVYRALIETINSLEIDECNFPKNDFDFLADRLTWWSHVPNAQREFVRKGSWGYGAPGRAFYENPFNINSLWGAAREFEKYGLKVDVFTMRAFQNAERTSDGSLFDYFRSMPLALQMLAFDVETGQFLGLGGLPVGIATREVHVNNLPQLRLAAKREGYTVIEYRDRKSWGFGLRKV